MKLKTKEMKEDSETKQTFTLHSVVNLLPCPFCGSKAEKRGREGTSDYDYNKIYYDIKCTNNECYLQDGADWNCDTYEEVVEMWNQRQ